MIHGPQGQNVSAPFARVHCGSRRLQVARGDVVGDGVAGDLAARAHHDDELDLVVEPPHDGAGSAPGPTGGALEVGSFMNTIGASGSSLPVSRAWAA